MNNASRAKVAISMETDSVHLFRPTLFSLFPLSCPVFFSPADCFIVRPSYPRFLVSLHLLLACPPHCRSCTLFPQASISIRPKSLKPATVPLDSYTENNFVNLALSYHSRFCCETRKQQLRRFFPGQMQSSGGASLC